MCTAYEMKIRQKASAESSVKVACIREKIRKDRLLYLWLMPVILWKDSRLCRRSPDSNHGLLTWNDMNGPDRSWQHKRYSAFVFHYLVVRFFCCCSSSCALAPGERLMENLIMISSIISIIILSPRRVPYCRQNLELGTSTMLEKVSVHFLMWLVTFLSDYAAAISCPMRPSLLWILYEV